MRKVIAVIPAAGRGTRMGASLPKQFLPCRGKELIAYTITAFEQCPLISQIYIVGNTEFFPLLRSLKEKFSFRKITGFIEGGAERQDSVYNALCQMGAAPEDLIAVHDAARPFIPVPLITSAVLTALEKGNALVCLPVKDTTLRATESEFSYLDRSSLYSVQTPQIFPYKELRAAFEAAYKENFYGTDESMLMHRIGHHIHIVEGSIYNFKVTTADDFKLCEQLTMNNEQ